VWAVVAVLAAGQAEARGSSRFGGSMAVEICTRKIGMLEQYDRHVLVACCKKSRGTSMRADARLPSTKVGRRHRVQTTEWARPEQVQPRDRAEGEADRALGGGTGVGGADVEGVERGGGVGGCGGW
jgi:hypothetical protein